MPEERFYQEHEADEILRIAVGDSSVTGAMTRERLVATAAELGIPPEAIDRAEQRLANERAEVERKRAEEAELAEFKADMRRKTWSSLSGWASTSVMLIGIDLLTSHTITWSVWPVGIWGLMEVGQVFENLLSGQTRGEKFERWKRKKTRRESRRQT